MSAKFTSYALLGSGRVARHFQFYLRSLNRPVVFWSRDGKPEFNSLPGSDASTRLHATIAQASHVLLALSDAAVAEIARPFGADNRGKTWVHFSGALQLNGVAAAHPLMTFGPRLGTEAWYRQIPFVLDRGCELSAVLPGLPNPSFHLNPEQRPLYHALCSLAGNSAFLLWQNLGEEMERRLALPRAILTPFLQQVVENADRGPDGFTGPVARRDWQTVSEHLHSLQHSRPELLDAYRGYLRLAAASGHPIPEEIL